jgi:hypothetical protein
LTEHNKRRPARAEFDRPQQRSAIVLAWQSDGSTSLSEIEADLICGGETPSPVMGIMVEPFAGPLLSTNSLQGCAHVRFVFSALAVGWRVAWVGRLDGMVC